LQQLCISDDHRRTSKHRKVRAECGEDRGEDKLRAGGGVTDPGPERAGAGPGNAALAAVGTTD